MSQAGMVVYQRRHRTPGWQRRMVINLIGAIATGIVLVVVVVSKFTEGAWIPALVIPLIVMMFKAIGRHYAGVKQEIAVPVGWKPKRRTHTMVVLVGSVNRGAMEAITYARSLAPDRIMAVSVVVDDDDQERISHQWAEHGIPIELHLIHSPYRALTRPVLAFLDELDADNPDDVITVVIPEFVVTKWYTQLLHNQSALALKARLLFRKSTIVTSVPVLVDRGDLEPTAEPLEAVGTPDERVPSPSRNSD